MSLQTLKPISIAVQTGIPVLTVGGPGVGKTSGLAMLGESLNRHVETVIASIREPSDFGGLPVITSQGDVKLAPPAWAKRLAEAQHGILFLDEISTAPPAVQAALLRVVLDRVVGDLKLPETVSIVAAANPTEESAGGWELAPPLANRFCHLPWRLDADAWVLGMLSGFPQQSFPRVPDGWAKNLPEAMALVASFVQAQKNKLYMLPKAESNQGKAWPSPRSWHMVSKLIAACGAAGVDRDTEFMLIVGCVGEGVGTEFVHWREALDLPNPETLLKNPDTFKLPPRGDQQFAVLASLTAAIVQNTTPERFKVAWKIFANAANQGAKDVAAASVQTLAKLAVKNPKLHVPPAILIPFREILRQAGYEG